MTDRVKTKNLRRALAFLIVSHKHTEARSTASIWGQAVFLLSLSLNSEHRSPNIMQSTNVLITPGFTHPGFEV